MLILSDGQQERSAPRPSWEKQDCRRWAHQEGPERGMARIPDSSPIPRLPWFWLLRHVTQRAAGTLIALWAGASSGRLAEGPHRHWPRRGAGAIIASIAALRRPQQEEPWRAPDPGQSWPGAPQLTYGRRELAPPPRTCGAQRALPRTADALVSVQLLATAVDHGHRSSGALAGPGCGKRTLVRAVWRHFYGQ